MADERPRHLDLNVCGLSLGATKRLVDHDARVRQTPPLALLSGTKKERTHRRGGAKADCVDIARHILHRIKDGHASGDGSAGRIDVERDVLLAVIIRQVEELRDEEVGHLIVDLLAEEEDTIAQEAREDVHLVVAHAHHWERHERAPLRRPRRLATRVHLGRGLVGRHAQAAHVPRRVVDGHVGRAGGGAAEGGGRGERRHVARHQRRDGQEGEHERGRRGKRESGL